MQMLIDAGASPQARDRDGDTPLHEVVRCFMPDQSLQYIAAAQVLLGAGASATAGNSQGISPLRAAAQKGLSQLESVLHNPGQGQGQYRMSPVTPNHSPKRPPTPGMPGPGPPDNMQWWEIKFCDLKLVRRLGEGGFGQVGGSTRSGACPAYAACTGCAACPGASIRSAVLQRCYNV